ncbi:MAG: PAS domain-containing protein, partial [Treponema sp.]|nr:PAS domain-containing protein [Treponema sp.]
RKLDHSIIKILNGFHSGRKEGSPITDYALSMLENIKENGQGQFRIYYSKSKYGKPVRSTTTIISGEGGKPIGMLCFNLYLDSPISSFLRGIITENKTDYVNEHFISSSDELIMNALEEARALINADKSIPASLKNKEILRSLYAQGIFNLKKSIDIAAKALELSKNTVYLHIREIEKQ